MQQSGALRLRQLVLRFRKVIHADKVIALLRQRRDGLLQDLQLQLRRRQLRLFDFTLRRKQRRQMRVVEYAHAVRIKRNHALQGIGEALRRLQRQAVDKIDAGRVKALRARARHQRKDRLFVLNAIYALLHRFIEILYAHAQPVKAELAQVRNSIGIDFSRIDFDRHLQIVRQAEVIPQQCHQP